jgi:hypothetical protein
VGFSGAGVALEAAGRITMVGVVVAVWGDEMGDEGVDVLLSSVACTAGGLAPPQAKRMRLVNRITRKLIDLM